MAADQWADVAWAGLEAEGGLTDTNTERRHPVLVLSRKKNEAVVIARGIRVCIVEIRADKVRLGFDADKSVEIHREEVLNEIVWRERRENAARCACGNLLREDDELNRGTCEKCHGTGGL